MKKTGLIALALVLALGAMGVGLAFWNETLTITGTVATGELDVEFSEQLSNDPSGDESLDPKMCGVWAEFRYDPGVWGWKGVRYDYDVASTDCVLIPDSGGPEDGDNQTLKITIDNAYPCYYGNVWFTIDNIGSIPAHIESIQLVEISKDDDIYTLTVPRDLSVCDTWYIDVDVPRRVETSPSAGDDFSIHLSGDLAVCQTIEVDGAMFGDICIHVEDGAEEETTYDFTILIVVTQFNAS